MYQLYYNASLVDGLPEGQQLLVTSNGKMKFIVSKSAHPRMTRKLTEERAVGEAGPKFDASAFLRTLRE